MYIGNLLTALGCIDAGITTVIDNSHNSRTAAHSDAAVEALLGMSAALRGLEGLRAADDMLASREAPIDARRLAWLIHDRSPDVNAALFAAPAAGCNPDLVEPQFCALPGAIMRQLKTRAAKGQLNALAADRAVWMRMAA